MRIHLVRHGDAEPVGEGPDAERALTEDGRRRMRRQADAIAALVPGLDRIATSPYQRARQTAAILADALAVDDVRDLDSLVPDGDPRRAAEALLDQADRATRIAVVGHRPQLADLAATLLGDDPDRFDVHLATGSLLSIRIDGADATLEQLVQARQLRALAEES